MRHRRPLTATLAALALVLFLPSVSQAIGIEKGVKAGLNLANFRGEFADLVGTETKMGFVGGPFVAFAFAPDLALQVEALFTMKGAKIRSEVTDMSGNSLGIYNTFVNVSYVEVPVLLRCTLLQAAPVHPMLYLGPTVGFNTRARVASDFGPFDEQKLDNLKTVDFGAAVGAGVGVKLGGQRLLADVRYTTGFADIYDIQGNAESINSVISITAGIAF